MAQRFAAFLAGVALMGAAWAGAPADIQVQGLYEGTGKDAQGECKLEVRVVAQGNGNYKVFVRRMIGEDKIARAELAGKTAGDSVSFAGQAGDVEWKGSYSAVVGRDGISPHGVIKGTYGDTGTFELKRVERKSPTLGKKPPEGAIVLLDGKDFSEVVRANGSQWYLGDMSQQGWTVWEVPLYTIAQKDPAERPSQDKLLPKDWLLSKELRRADMVIGIGEDGSIQVPKGGINTKRSFEGNLDLHVEFMNPFMPTAHSQGRGNSGFYLPSGDEIQVLDSFGETTYLGGSCGGLYNWKDADAMEEIESLKGKTENKFPLASLPPETWQTYDIEYRVEKKDGKYAGKPRVTVYHNGIKIHDNAAVHGDPRKGNVHLQDHGNPVRYRNIWVLPVEPK